MTGTGGQSEMQNFLDALLEALAAAATAVSDRTWTGQLAGDAKAGAGAVEVALAIEGSLRGTLVLRVPAAQAQLLAPATNLEELWQRVGHAAAEQMGRVLGTRAGGVAVKVAGAWDRSATLHAISGVVLRASDEFTAVPVECLADEPLHRALEAQARLPAAEASAAYRPAPMDRVVDVPLAVTIRFGQRQLMLRELLDLSAGSLLELDRVVEDPVDLMLGERVIARGEVVIVDGNYGMRITEVLESSARSAGARDRLQTWSYASA